jgi:predicted Fe-Mo cluster-binding NifX family protein
MSRGIGYKTLQESTRLRPNRGVIAMRLALPVWENKISPVLDTATRLMVVEVEEQGEVRRSEIRLHEKDLSGRCRRIQALGVDALICGAVTRQMSDMLKQGGIYMIPGISGQPEEVLDACLGGRLAHSKYILPGWSLDGVVKRLKGLNLGKWKRQKRKRDAQ